MADDKPSPKRRRRAVATVDKQGAGAPEAVAAAPKGASRAELEAENASLKQQLADAQRAIKALASR